MGNRSKALRAGGAFGKKQFVALSRKKIEPYEHVIPPDPATGSSAKTETRYRTVKETILVGVKRPTRTLGRQKDRITRKLGKRTITMTKPVPGGRASSAHSKETGPASFFKRMFQRKGE